MAMPTLQTRNLCDVPQEALAEKTNFIAEAGGYLQRVPQTEITGQIEDVRQLVGETRTKIETEMGTRLDTKVDKVEGKGLSTNDYTDTDKAKLAGMEEGANKTVVDSALSETSANPVQNQAVHAALAGKVPETRTVNRKALTRDITLNAEDVGAIPAVQKGAASGVAELDGEGKVPSAQLPPQTQSDWTVTDAGSAAYIRNKPFALQADGGDSDTVNGHTVETDVPPGAVFTDTTYGVVTGEADGLMAAADKAKLDGMEDGANRTIVDSALSETSANPVQNQAVHAALAGKAPMGHTHTTGQITDFPDSLPANGGNADTVGGHTVGTDVPAGAVFTDTVYVHPETHPATMIVEDETHRFVSDTEKATWNAKAGTAVATQSADGLMSAADKTKLDGMEAGGAGGVTGVKGNAETAYRTGDVNLTPANLGAAPTESPVFTGAISLGRDIGTEVGQNSFAVGLDITASGYSSHAEGAYTEASGLYSHAEGYDTFASGSRSHSEGYVTGASGESSHAEGVGARASGGNSHSEGYSTKASGLNSHAEGYITEASGVNSHAEGAGTKASNYASHASGKCNKVMAGGGTYDNMVGDAMTIGNGIGTDAPSNALRVTYTGTVYGQSNFNSTGADYAEFFEWQDGNPTAEDRVGYFVTLDGNQIKPAYPDDYLLGIVSGQPCIIGNSDEDWLGRWEHDEFGRFVKEDVDTPVTKPEIVEVPVLDADGNPTGRTRPERIEVETGEINHGWRYKANPDYDASQPYIERKDRPEWSAVGMLGVLSVRDNGECQVNGFCTCGAGGIAVPTEDRKNGYRVIKRMTDSVVQVVFR